MYIKTIRTFVTTATFLVTTSLLGNTVENFNSRDGVPVKHLKATLQNACWTFHHFNVNSDAWKPAIEGDGALVSNITALSAGNAGIYTPLLAVSSDLSVSFLYTFSEDFDITSSRWIKLCLADENNNILQVLDELHLNGIRATKVSKYSTTFNNIRKGEYRLLLLYGGQDGKSEIAIDDLKTSAPFKFPAGCNMAPDADDILIEGTSDRKASGSLIANNKQDQRAFLVRNSDDGTVELAADGTFIFRPYKNFSGESTSFSYRLCNSDGAGLCSEPLLVKINFPSSKLTRFNGSYRHGGNVELAWNTAKGSALRAFEIERSTDGKKWSRAGAITVQHASTNTEYTYLDKVGKNKALKKDIYYRLKHTDTDGNVNTTKPMVVRVYGTNSLTMICVAPTPQKREISVNVQVPESSMVTMRVFDHSRAVVLYKTVRVNAGDNNLVVEGSQELIPGNYQLEVIVNSKERMTVKLLKE